MGTVDLSTLEFRPVGEFEVSDHIDADGMALDPNQATREDGEPLFIFDPSNRTCAPIPKGSDYLWPPGAWATTAPEAPGMEVPSDRLFVADVSGPVSKYHVMRYDGTYSPIGVPRELLPRLLSITEQDTHPLFEGLYDEEFGRAVDRVLAEQTEAARVVEMPPGCKLGLHGQPGDRVLFIPQFDMERAAS